jgi:uncharacterized membrane protein
MTSPSAVPGPPVPQRTTDANFELVRWQGRLLPFMSRFLVALAVGFFVISLVEVNEVRKFVTIESTQTVRQKIEQLLTQGDRAGTSADIAQQALLLLEADTLEKRYRGASALLVSRIWNRHLAFTTGMVLAFMGAVFIIGKLTETRSVVNVGASDWKAGISSSSPGLVLAFFGTLLMGIALVVQPQIEVQDRPVYFMATGLVKNVTPAPSSTVQNAPLPDPFDSSPLPTKKAKSNSK